MVILSLALAAPLFAAGIPTYKVEKADIAKMSAELQGVFAGLQYILNAYQARQFLSLENDSVRVQWIDKYWKSRDPTPTTKKNEMRVEHEIRVMLARQFFGMKKWPGWDKRGEVFIRYGPPDYRGKIWGEVTIKRVRPPGEIWYYVGHDMMVSFENFGLKGEYIYSIDPLGSWVKLSPDLIEFLLFDTRKPLQSLTEKIPIQYMDDFNPSSPAEIPDFVDPQRTANYLMARPRDLPEDIDAIMDPDMSGMVPTDVAAVFHRDRMREVANNFEITLEDTPSSYPFNFEDKSLPFFFGVDQFKAGRSVNRVEVQIEIPVEKEKEEHGGGENVYEAEVVVWDPDYNELDRGAREIVYRADTGKTGTALLPTQMVFSLPRGYYRIAVAVRERNSGRTTAYRTSFNCDPYIGPLALSDILFARKIQQVEEPTIFTRGPLDVVPHPARVYNRTFAVPVYFEIYNLTLDTAGLSSYTVEYKITPHSPRKEHFWDQYDNASTAVSSEFEGSSHARDVTQHLFIHVDNLPKGSYDFLITVTDNLTGDVAFKKGAFSVIVD